MDTILGMDWMNRNGKILDISSRAVELNSPILGNSTLYLPFRECINSCAFAMKDINLEDIPVVCEYADVFLDDLPGMPLDRALTEAVFLPTSVNQKKIKKKQKARQAHPGPAKAHRRRAPSPSITTAEAEREREKERERERKERRGTAGYGRGRRKLRVWSLYISSQHMGSNGPLGLG